MGVASAFGHGLKLRSPAPSAKPRAATSASNCWAFEGGSL
jgi:hypothetical protein